MRSSRLAAIVLVHPAGGPPFRSTSRGLILASHCLQFSKKLPIWRFRSAQNRGMHDSVFAEILSEVSTFAKAATTLTDLQRFIVEIIPDRLPYYNWTGFYMLDNKDPEMLVLGPFHGAPTEHVRIPVNQGICGAAVAQNDTVIVDDVASDPRYLACSFETRSEIVVPIRAHGAVVGEIDIDSHEHAAFGPEEERLVRDVAEALGERWLEEPAADRG